MRSCWLAVLLAVSACASVVPPETDLSTEARHRQLVYVRLLERGLTPAEARDAMADAYGGLDVADAVQRTATADSLLAVPPDSLSDPQARWLLVYLNEEEVTDREVFRSRHRPLSAVQTALIAGAVLVGTVGGYVLLEWIDTE